MQRIEMKRLLDAAENIIDIVIRNLEYSDLDVETPQELTITQQNRLQEILIDLDMIKVSIPEEQEAK